MVELFSQSRYSKKMGARKGAAGGEPEGYAGRKITLIFLMFKKNRQLLFCCSSDNCQRFLFSLFFVFLFNSFVFFLYTNFPFHLL